MDFNPLEVVSPASPSSAASVSSAETLPKIRFARREHGGASSRRRGHARSRSHSRRQEPSSRRHSIRAEDEADSLREYHPDPQVKTYLKGSSGNEHQCFQHNTVHSIGYFNMIIQVMYS